MQFSRTCSSQIDSVVELGKCHVISTLMATWILPALGFTPSRNIIGLRRKSSVNKGLLPALQNAESDTNSITVLKVPAKFALLVGVIANIVHHLVAENKPSDWSRWLHKISGDFRQSLTEFMAWDMREMAKSCLGGCGDQCRTSLRAVQKHLFLWDLL